MNIIQAREAAMKGKTVICPLGREFTADSFIIFNGFGSEIIFGEWRVKQEPVVFYSSVVILNENSWDTGIVYGQELRALVGKRVRVTVECVE